MADRGGHTHPTTSHKVLVAVGGQDIDEETVRLACRMTDPQGGRLYGVHIIEVNRSLPLGAVLDDVVDRGEKILDEVEKLAAASQLLVETELVQARDTGPALVAALQEAVRGVQPGQDRALRAEERELPRDAVPGAPRAPRGRSISAASNFAGPPSPSGALPQPAKPDIRP